MSRRIYDYAKNDILNFLINSSYKERTRELNMSADINFCLSIDKYKDVPFYKEGKLLID